MYGLDWRSPTVKEPISSSGNFSEKVADFLSDLCVAGVGVHNQRPFQPGTDLICHSSNLTGISQPGRMCGIYRIALFLRVQAHFEVNTPCKQTHIHKHTPCCTSSQFPVITWVMGNPVFHTKRLRNRWKTTRVKPNLTLEWIKSKIDECMHVLVWTKQISV